jgi:Transmembrane secretion effector
VLIDRWDRHRILVITEVAFMLQSAALAVIASLLAMRITREVRPALLLLALVSITGMTYMVLMPAVAREILHGGPHTYGFLLTASGLGTRVGALYLAAGASVVGLERAIAVAACAFGAGLIAFSLSHVL